MPGHIPFWFRPVSIFGLSNITAFSSTSPGLTLPRTAGPRPPCDAGSRRVGSRFHDRPFGRGYVVPQASYQPVARKARCGSRPMAERRVTSFHLLGGSCHRSIKCDESHQHLVRLDLLPTAAEILSIYSLHCNAMSQLGQRTSCVEIAAPQAGQSLGTDSEYVTGSTNTFSRTCSLSRPLGPRSNAGHCEQ
jgi:hypothetical protein